MNKGKISSEELRLQLAESLPGAIQIFARSMGKSEAELFKMMENGELLAEDVLPKVAKEMNRMANSGGALEQKLKTTRVQQGIFFKELETAGNTIFTSGFDEGLATLFNSLSTALKEGREGLVGLGKTFKWFFETISLGVKIVSPLLDSILFVTGELFGGLNNLNNFLGNNFISTLIIVAGALLGITKIFKSFPKFAKYLPFLGKAFKDIGDDAIKTTKSVTILGTAFRLALRSPLAIAALIIAALDEIFSMFTKGRVGLLEEWIFGKDVGFDTLDEFIDYIKNINGTDIGIALGEAIGDAIVWTLKDGIPSAFTFMLEVFNSMLDYIGNINWINVFTRAGVAMGEVMYNTLFSVAGVFAGLIDKLLQGVWINSNLAGSVKDTQEEFDKKAQAIKDGAPIIEEDGTSLLDYARVGLTMATGGLFDFLPDAGSFSGKVNKIKTQADSQIKDVPPSVDNSTVIDNSSPTSVSNTTVTPSASYNNNNQSYVNNKSLDKSRSSTNVSNTVNVTVQGSNVSESNFGNQAAIADEIAAKVEEAINRTVTGAELSNGG